MTSAQTRQISSGGTLIFLACIITALCPAIHLVIGCRQFEVDMRETVFHSIMIIPLFLVTVCPIQLILLYLVGKRCVRPLTRTLIVLSPALLIALAVFINAMLHPVDARAKFASLMDHCLESDSTNFRTWRIKGFGDSIYMFCFNTTPQDIHQLLASRPYEPDDRRVLLMTDPQFRSHYELPVGGLVTPKGWPKPPDWPGLRVYRFNKDNWFYYVLTDDKKTKAFVIAGCT